MPPVLQVSGPERDLHSGNDGGVFHEPMADLVQLLGSLHGPGGKISVPGFHNNVRPQLMELAWQGLEHSEEFSMRSYRWGLGQGAAWDKRAGQRKGGWWQQETE